MRRLLLFLVALLLPFALTGCDLFGNDDDETTVTSGVYVANAGAFGNQNSSLTVYNPSSGDTQTLPPPNQPGFTSYIQSITIDDGRLFVAFGETATVDVFDTGTNERIGQITGIPNPRYVAVDGQTAYVTSLDFGADASDLDVVDLETNTVVDSVDVSGTPETVVVAGSRVVVALGGFSTGSSVALIDRTSLDVETVDVDCTGPRSLVADADDEIVVFCTGRAAAPGTDAVPGAIRVIDPETGAILDRVDLTTQIASASFGQHVSYSAGAEEAYALLATGDVLRYDTATNAVDARLDVDGAPTGALAYDDRSERLYVGRLATSGNPFDTPGTVTVHERGGVAVDTIDAGVAPTHIDFALETQ